GLLPRDTDRRWAVSRGSVTSNGAESRPTADGGRRRAAHVVSLRAHARKISRSEIPVKLVRPASGSARRRVADAIPPLPHGQGAESGNRHRGDDVPTSETEPQKAPRNLGA